MEKCEVNNLTKNEYAVLTLLKNNKDKIFTRKEILLSLNNNNVSLRSIDTLISRLRKKINNRIKTKPGFGYYYE